MAVPLNAHDRQLLGALGREAALRLRTVSQADELEARLHQIEQQAAEIAASRARIVEAQDEERRRIERDIHDGVQQELASLVGKLRLALDQLRRSPDDASATIAGAQDDVRRTLADVRAIAQGIHPAILDDHGIVRAIDARAKRLPLEVTVDATPELAGRRFDRSGRGCGVLRRVGGAGQHRQARRRDGGGRPPGGRRRPADRSASATTDEGSATTSSAGAGSRTWPTGPPRSGAA